MKERLLIFGGGFISYNVIKNLKDKFRITLCARKNFEDLEGYKFIQVSDFQKIHEIDTCLDDLHNKDYYVLITCATGGSRLKKDSWKDYVNNIESFMNIVQSCSGARRIFYIGSGAGQQAFYKEENDFYALSKRVISRFITTNSYDKLTELVVYGSFGEKELPTRFVRSCFENCKKGLPIYINKNIKFDFISMYDFSSILGSAITKNDPCNQTFCTYEEKLTLEEVARIINGFYDNKSVIIVQEEAKYPEDSDYVSPWSDYDMYWDECLGLKESLQKLKEEYYDKLKE